VDETEVLSTSFFVGSSVPSGANTGAPTVVSVMPSQEDAIEKLRDEMEKKKGIMDTMKIAYLHSTPFRDHVPTYEDLKSAAQEFIKSNYEFQKAYFGKVKVRFSVANLLR
jgi:hypothetical protein